VDDWTGGLAMSLLDHPDAQALLADATLTPEAVIGCQGRLTAFLQRYLPRFYRVEQRAHAGTVIRGLLSGLERKTCEPIASQAGLHRKTIQTFVGQGAWDDEAVIAALRDHIRDELADPRAIVILDSSGFIKKGTASCGVARQWCGRLGKVDNCQLGLFLAYAAPGGCALVDRRLYLPEDWAADADRREATHVPQEVTFQEAWRIAADLLRRNAGLPHAWVVGDDEFGRPSAFRRWLRQRGERYLLDVPCNTTIRDLEQRRPPRRRAGVGRKREVPFGRVDTWAARQPATRWARFTVRDGEKGPLVVEAMTVRVRAKQERRIGLEERLLVVRTVEAQPRTSYSLSDAADVALGELVRVHGTRPRIEELFGSGKGDAGLAQYEVRSWVGWHHHVTLSLLALWFLCLERRQIGGENPGGDRVAGAADPQPVVAGPGGDGGGDRRGDHAGAAPERRVADLPLVCGHPELSPASGAA
jgi:SRSO17 transposase